MLPRLYPLPLPLPSLRAHRLWPGRSQRPHLWSLPLQGPPRGSGGSSSSANLQLALPSSAPVSGPLLQGPLWHIPDCLAPPRTPHLPTHLRCFLLIFHSSFLLPGMPVPFLVWTRCRPKPGVHGRLECVPGSAPHLPRSVPALPRGGLPLECRLQEQGCGRSFWVSPRAWGPNALCGQRSEGRVPTRPRSSLWGPWGDDGT